MQSEFSSFKAGRRKAVNFSQESLVKSSYLEGAETFPLVLQPEVEHVNLSSWASNSREQIEAQLLQHGAILFRGFKVETVERFEEFARVVSPELLDYRERSSPRTEVTKGIYTSTDYPADQPIHFHNEQSYTKSWPMKLWFYCVTAAEQGGATPIADGRKVLGLIDPKIKERFLEKRVIYVRNYGDGLGLPWQTAFQATRPSEVEAYCRQADIEFQWKDGNRLRTRQTFDTIVAHPKTHEQVWFEHTAFFHISSLDTACARAQCSLLITGHLDLARLRQALLSLIQRHEILRTSFPLLPGMDLPVQVIKAEARCDWRELDLRAVGDSSRSGEQAQAVKGLEEQERERRFDYAVGEVVQVVVARLSEERQVVVLSVGGMSGDGETMQNLVRELGREYVGARRFRR